MRIFSARSPVPTCERRVSRDLLRLALLLVIEEAGAEHGHGPDAVLQLRALVLADDDDAGRQVRDAHGGGDLLDVLAAGAAAVEDVDAQVVLVDVDVDLLGLGQHGDRRRRGVDAALRLGRRHALDAVDAALVLQARVGALAVDLEDDLLEAADAALAVRHDFDLSSRALSA